MNSREIVSAERRTRNQCSGGYVHKFRLESRDGGLIDVKSPVAGATMSVAWLLAKFICAAVILSATLAAGAGALKG